MANLTTITGMEYLNTSEVTSMTGMFANCTSITTLDLSRFNTANVENMVAMFSDCTNLTTIYVGDGWTTDDETIGSEMFTNCTALEGGNGTRYDADHVDKEYARIDADGTPGYLTYKDNKEAYAVYTEDNTTLTFYYDKLRSSRTGTTYELNTGSNDPGWKSDGTNALVTNVVFDPSFAGARPTTTCEWFRNMTNLTTITGIEYLNTSEVINMNSMFDGCSSLTSLDLSHFNTQNVQEMVGMFYDCSNLESLDLRSFNTANVTGMVSMFKGCSSLKSLDVSSFNTQNVWGINVMFDGCSSLKSLDLSSFNTENVTNMAWMFYGCSSLTTIYVGTGWNTAKVTSSDYMFYDSHNLVGGAGTVYNDANPKDKTYARIDGGPDSDTPGYFTLKTEPYVVLSTDGTTLTFYDDGDNNKPGFVYKLEQWSWRGKAEGEDVTTVVFDPSFANARPTHTINWFAGLINLTTISGMEYLNTSEVTEMAAMFASCSSLTTLDLSSFNTANVINMNVMFAGCTRLTTIYVGDGWSTDAVNSSTSMFEICTSLVGGMGTPYDAGHKDAEYAHVDGGPSNPGYFTYKATFMLGDVNGDGKVDVADITALTNHLLGIEGAYNSIAADVDENGEVTSADVPVLVSIILGR